MAANVMSAQDGAILAGANATADARQALQATITKTNSDVEALGNQFQGQASVAFIQLMQQWHEESNSINSALVQFEDKLRKQQSNLDAGEQQQSSAFAKIAASLGGN
ncbi:MAG: WXG100 family type VII secretion target [Propionibacteriaceae bacterium]|nr:WXG100 family type VII secretion target [Propionibacteriaceae bacterium]